METNTALLERFANGESSVESELLEQNMGLVKAAAKRLLPLAGSVDFEDLCQIGSIGLIKAIRRFELERNVAFSTYAVPLIIGEIKRFLRSDSPVKISRNLKAQYYQIRLCCEKLSKQLGREPTLGEIAADTGFSKEDIILALDASEIPASIDEPLDSDGEFTLADTLSTPEALSSTDKIALTQALSRLEGRDRQLIVLRYYMQKTQQQTADLLSMTQVQVSRREKKLLEQMKNFLL